MSIRRAVGGPLLRGIGVISVNCGTNEACVGSVFRSDYPGTRSVKQQQADLVMGPLGEAEEGEEEREKETEKKG